MGSVLLGFLFDGFLWVLFDGFLWVFILVLCFDDG